MASQLTSELLDAAKEGNQERCQQLLSQGIDVNASEDEASQAVFYHRKLDVLGEFTQTHSDTRFSRHIILASSLLCFVIDALYC